MCSFGVTALNVRAGKVRSFLAAIKVRLVRFPMALFDFSKASLFQFGVRVTSKKGTNYTHNTGHTYFHLNQRRYSLM